MYFNNHKAATAACALALSFIFWIGCGSKKPNEQETTAALPPLPSAEVAKLKPVPHRNMLATSEVLSPATPPPETAIHPACAANGSETDYTVEVKYGVGVCTTPGGFPSVPYSGAITQSNFAPTHKLEATTLSDEQKAVFQPPLGGVWCYIDSGPWQGYITSTRGCSGSCSPDNVLTLTNAPNLVVISWYGSVFDHPAGFDYVSSPKSQGTADQGRCHAQN